MGEQGGHLLAACSLQLAAPTPCSAKKHNNASGTQAKVIQPNKLGAIIIVDIRDSW